MEAMKISGLVAPEDKMFSVSSYSERAAGPTWTDLATTYHYPRSPLPTRSSTRRSMSGRSMPFPSMVAL